MNENNLNLGPKVDIRKYPTITCTYCGGIGFKNITIVKKVPGVLLGQGTDDQYIPLQVYACDTCNKIWEEDAKALGLLDNNESETKPEEKTEQKEILFKL